MIISDKIKSFHPLKSGRNEMATLIEKKKLVFPSPQVGSEP